MRVSGMSEGAGFEGGKRGGNGPAVLRARMRARARTCKVVL